MNLRTTNRRAKKRVAAAFEGAYVASYWMTPSRRRRKKQRDYEHKHPLTSRFYAWRQWAQPAF